MIPAYQTQSQQPTEDDYVPEDYHLDNEPQTKPSTSVCITHLNNIKECGDQMKIATEFQSYIWNVAWQNTVEVLMHMGLFLPWTYKC